MLYPYLNTPGGLSQWFADDVTVDEDKVFNFIWDQEDHKAKMATFKTNSSVKYQFIGENGHDDEDAGYVEFKLEQSELTQSVFLRITDYSDNDDEEELEDLWEGLVTNLREIVGG